MSLLDISDIRILEDMVIECIYGGLLSGRLDNKYQQMTVDYVSSRDFKAEDAPKLFDKLSKWTTHVEKVETMLEQNLKSAKKNLEENEKKKKDVKVQADAAYNKALLEIGLQQTDKRVKGIRFKAQQSGYFRVDDDSD